MKAALATIGCKVNSYETEAVAEILKQHGYEIVDFKAQADVYVINTCTVTNTSDQKSRQTIRKAVDQAPEAIVCVMGCYSQLQADQVASIPGVHIVLGTKDRHRIPDFIENYRSDSKPIIQVEPLRKTEAFEVLTIEAFARHQRAFLKIEDGCDQFCSYCIVPFARGRIRSKAPEQVLKEAAELTENGFREIVLTGIHTGGYGRDLANYRFVDLLRDLVKMPRLDRLRISSIEITELTAEVIAVLASSPRFAFHLHVPLQSGSARILQAMNRPYSKAEYLAKIKEIRQALPGIAITTDVIAGFPGETDADFEEMMDFIETIGFSELHVFPFSKRDGTVAAKMPGQVDGTTKKMRVARLLEQSERLAKKYIRENIGVRLEAIAETGDSGFLTGHTGNYVRVRFPGDREAIGQLIPVQITAEAYPLSPAITIQ